jgi:hypothetical protein
MPRKKRGKDDGTVRDITTYAWEYSKTAGGDFDGTFNAKPTYLVLVDLFTELIAPAWSEAASIAQKERITLDEAMERLRQAEINKCLEHAQGLIIEGLGKWLVDVTRQFAFKIAVQTLSDLRKQLSTNVPPPGMLLNAMIAGSYAADKERMKVETGRGQKY